MMIESTNSFCWRKDSCRKKILRFLSTVGYMDPSTPGSIIASARKGDKIQLTDREKKTEVKCSIKNFRFSAHSKREELISLVKKLNSEKVVLIHGDKEAINWMGASILKQFPGKKVYAAENFKKMMFD